MRYKLKKDLPFAKSGSVFSTGCWVGGGFGIDMGSAPHGAHNGVRTFEPHENSLLEKLVNNDEWIEKIPTSLGEALDLFRGGQDVNKYLCFVEERKP